METREAYVVPSAPATAPPRGKAGGNRGIAHTALVRLITDYLEVQGAWVLKVAGGLGQRAGVPDLLSYLQGRLVAIEAKTGSAVLSTSQQRERVALERAGAVFVEARTLEDVVEALRIHQFRVRGVLQ